MICIQTGMILEFPVEIIGSEKFSSDKRFIRKEKFKGKQFFELINHNQLNRRIMRPIKIEQTTLIKYFPCLKINSLTTDGNRCLTRSKEQSYTLVLVPDHSLHIKEKHCLQCGTRLVKNGSNTRKVFLDKWKGKRTFRLMRKRCPKCGEIRPDYSKLAPRNCNYNKNYKLRARQHYTEGLMPPQIQRALKIDFGIKISKTTIVRWINELEEPLRTVLRETPVPSSGYWGYDEIHMKIAGKKRYTIDTVDLNTRFVPVARITERMGREIGKEVLVEGRKQATLEIKGLIKDCSTNLGGLFKTRCFKNVKLQNCITHVKWIMARHVKIYAGVPSGSTKSLPKEWKWLLRLFYNVIDSKNETDIYIRLEILRNAINRLSEKRIKRLIKAFRQLEKWLPKLIAHQRDPFLPSTNNLLESFHKKYNYYPSFKKHMMTEQGAQRVLDYRVFWHNLRLFPKYIQQYEAKYERWRALMPEMKGDRIYQGQANHFRGVFKKLDTWYGKYQEVWEVYFAVQ